MPTVIDFNNGVDGNTVLNATNTTQSVGYTDEGIDFTFSASAINGSALMQFPGTASANAFFVRDEAFTGAGDRNDDTLQLTFGGTMSGTAGDQIILAVATTGSATGFSGPWLVSMTHSTAGGTQTGVLNGLSQTLSFNGTFTGIKFTSQNGPGNTAFMNIKSLTVKSINCFVGDVQITTPEGKKEVQTLEVGDKLSTADGGETTIRWIGTQQIDTRLMHPRAVNPICIHESAIAPGVPSRDLFVSQDHAIAIDGTLYTAATLVNGATIYQVRKAPIDGFTYYHIETDAHELILAEDCPAETFIDYAGRESFENGDEAGRSIAEMALPRISTPRLVPEQIRERLAPVPIAAE